MKWMNSCLSGKRSLRPFSMWAPGLRLPAAANSRIFGDPWRPMLSIGSAQERSRLWGEKLSQLLEAINLVAKSAIIRAIVSQTMPMACSKLPNPP